MKRIFVLVLVLAFLTGCTSTTGGKLNLKLTDAPGDAESVMVTFSDIAVHKADENLTDNESWVVVLSGEKTYDLIKLKDKFVDLASADLPAGKYTQVRLSVIRASAVIDGKEYGLTIPSKDLKFIQGFDIVQGETTTLTFDFDADKSLVNVQGKYMLNSNIKIIEG